MIAPETIQSLTRPDAYDHPAEDVRLIQTHISWVLLAGEFAYKVKKLVRFGFLDYSSLDRREEMCRREVQLNQRTCPDAYLGVVPVVVRSGRVYVYGSGEPIDYAVKMRRLSEDGWLSALVEQHRATPELLRRVADSVHAFHSTAASAEAIAPFGSASEVAAIWRENLEEIAAFAGDTLSPDQLRDITRYGERFLRPNASLIDERAATGRVRDCHGDLRTDSIHVEPNGHICMTDCIEFSDRLRCGDVAGDVAFMAMDLDFRGRADLSDEFAGRYVELSADDEALPHMLPFYRCYRAVVRGKVESITTREAEIDRAQVAEAHGRASRYFALARRYTVNEAPQALIVVGGLSGTGKSHLSAALAARIGAVLVRSDAVRKSLLSGHDGAVAASYSAEERARVYELAREHVRTHLQAGRTVVFDATHTERRERDAARTLAAAAGVRTLLAWVDAPEGVIRRRLAAREKAPGDISDARWGTYLAQRELMEPLTEVEKRDCIELDGSQEASANIAVIRASLGQPAADA